MMLPHPLFSLENIYRAYRQCRRRKRTTHNALDFETNLEENLLALHQELNAQSYHPGSSQVFLVEKPKRREIFAADFRDRVVHHVLVHHLEKKWERIFIHDSYACRKGKGTHKGVERVQEFTRKLTCNGTRQAWFLQLDIKGYFIAIDRRILFDRLTAHEKDPDILWLVRTLLFYEPVLSCRFRGTTRDDFLQLPDHKTLFKAQPYCGLPIGNLTSQFFANVYLDALDQFVKHRLKAMYYVRYCDDFVVLSEYKEQLEAWKESIEQFLWSHLRLRLNDKERLQPIACGIDFLGYIVRPDYLLVRNRVAGALYERLFVIEHALLNLGMKRDSTGHVEYPWDWPLLERMRRSIGSYRSHLKHASSHRLWNDLLSRFSWLNEYFIESENRMQVRYPSPRYLQSWRQQKIWFNKQFPGHILMIRLGSFWEMTASRAEWLPDQRWNHRRFPVRRMDAIGQILWKHNRPVAWIEENGRRMFDSAERVLVKRWAYQTPTE